jgi:uncharacterized protein (DUF924 family)
VSSFQEILRFWFEEIEPKKYWVKDAEFDSLISQHFADIHRQACLGELFKWRVSAAGRLAEIIILDQFSRNMFRDTAQSFAQDGQALALAQEAVAQCVD